MGMDSSTGHGRALRFSSPGRLPWWALEVAGIKWVAVRPCLPPTGTPLSFPQILPGPRLQALFWRLGWDIWRQVSQLDRKSLTAQPHPTPDFRRRSGEEPGAADQKHMRSGGAGSAAPPHLHNCGAAGRQRCWLCILSSRKSSRISLIALLADGHVHTLS